MPEKGKASGHIIIPGHEERGQGMRLCPEGTWASTTLAESEQGEETSKSTWDQSTCIIIIIIKGTHDEIGTSCTYIRGES